MHFSKCTCFAYFPFICLNNQIGKSCNHIENPKEILCSTVRCACALAVLSCLLRSRARSASVFAALPRSLCSRAGWARAHAVLHALAPSLCCPVIAALALSLRSRARCARALRMLPRSMRSRHRCAPVLAALAPSLYFRARFAQSVAVMRLRLRYAPVLVALALLLRFALAALTFPLFFRARYACALAMLVCLLRPRPRRAPKLAALAPALCSSA